MEVMYIITDGNNYIKIRNGEVTTTSNINQAQTFDSFLKSSQELS